MKFLNSKKTIVVLLLVLAAVLLAIRDMKNDAEISSVENMEVRASRILGARVDILGAPDWGDGEVSVPGLTVANPTGFSSRDMISVNSIRAWANLESRVIDKVKFDGVEVAIEFQGDRSNIESVGERVVASAEREGESTKEENSGDAETSEGDNERGEAVRDDWVVKRVEFNGLMVSVQADWTDEVMEFDSQGFVVENLDGGTDNLVRSVVTGFLDNVVSSAAERVEDDRLRERLLEKIGTLRRRVGETGG